MIHKAYKNVTPPTTSITNTTPSKMDSILSSAEDQIEKQLHLRCLDKDLKAQIKANLNDLKIGKKLNLDGAAVGSRHAVVLTQHCLELGGAEQKACGNISKFQEIVHTPAPCTPMAKDLEESKKFLENFPDKLDECCSDEDRNGLLNQLTVHARSVSLEEIAKQGGQLIFLFGKPRAVEQQNVFEERLERMQEEYPLHIESCKVSDWERLIPNDDNAIGATFITDESCITLRGAQLGKSSATWDVSSNEKREFGERIESNIRQEALFSEHDWLKS